MPALVKPLLAHVLTQSAWLILSDVNEYPVRARDALSETHPAAVQPEGMEVPTGMAGLLETGVAGADEPGATGALAPDFLNRERAQVPPHLLPSEQVM